MDHRRLGSQTRLRKVFQNFERLWHSVPTGTPWKDAWLSLTRHLPLRVVAETFLVPCLVRTSWREGGGSGKRRERGQS